MKSRRVLAILLSVIFAAILVFVFFFTFTVRKINTSFDLYAGSEEESEQLKSKLDKFLGKNWLFVTDAEIREIVEEYPLFDLTDFQKNYPNEIVLKISQCREVYLVDYGTKTYVMSDEGKITREYDGAADKQYIELNIDELGVKELAIGKVLSTENQESFINSLRIAGSVKLTDNVKSMKVERKASTDVTKPIGTKQTVIVFDTYTEVSITVWDSDDGGLSKAAAVFGKYDEISDYEKSFYDIEVYYDSYGEIVIIWTKDGNTEVVS